MHHLAMTETRAPRGTTNGEDWVRAISARDRSALAQLLADDIDFRGVTPRRAWEGTTPDAVVDVVLGDWFGDRVSIDEVEEVTTGVVGETRRVGFRFRTTTSDGPHLIEQQAYYRDDGERMGYLRIVCSGYNRAS